MDNAQFAEMFKMKSVKLEVKVETLLQKVMWAYTAVFDRQIMLMVNRLIENAPIATLKIDDLV